MPLPYSLGAFYFAYFAYAGVLVAYLPVYFAWRGLHAAEIAFILALPQFARIFAPAAWGAIADRSAAPRGIVMLSCGITAAAFALLPFAAGAVDIALLIVLMSVLNAGALPLVEAITLSSLAAQGGGNVRRYGPIRLWGSVGFVLTVLAGGVWLDVFSAASLPGVLAVLALVSLVAAQRLPAAAVSASPPKLESLRFGTAAWLLLGAGFCMAAAHGTLYAFFSLHLQGLGYSGTLIGALWMLGVLAEIVVFAYLPDIFRRYSLSAVIAASFLCAIARFLALGWAAGMLWVAALAQLLHAGTFGAFHAASVAAVQRVFPDSAQARGQALFSGLAYGAGGALGALAAGWAWEAAGPGPSFSLSALFGLAGLLLAYPLKRAGL
jgi:MFS transporter, PPP family, 3-phenylpropionic acid transporter